ncbi:MAG: RNA 2',3'-cyclic phosphodiesterase [Armatimonadota bacterium]
MADQRVIRTFVAICLDEEIRGRISEVQERVKKLTTQVRWVQPGNFHVTLKFLGDVTPKKLSVVQSALDELAAGYEAFDLSVAGVGVFPTPRRPRVIWVGVEDGREQLEALASGVEQGLVRAGFEKEQKPFRSHITIGRVKESKPVEGLLEGLQEIDAQGLGSQRVDSVVLMESVLQSGGPIYTPLSVHKLA